MQQEQTKIKREPKFIHSRITNSIICNFIGISHVNFTYDLIVVLSSFYLCIVYNNFCAKEKKNKMFHLSDGLHSLSLFAPCNA